MLPSRPYTRWMAWGSRHTFQCANCLVVTNIWRPQSSDLWVPDQMAWWSAILCASFLNAFTLTNLFLMCSLWCVISALCRFLNSGPREQYLFYLCNSLVLIKLLPPYWCYYGAIRQCDLWHAFDWHWSSPCRRGKNISIILLLLSLTYSDHWSGPSS